MVVEGSTKLRIMDGYELKKLNDVTVELKADTTDLLNMALSAQQMAEMKADGFRHMNDHMHTYYHEKAMQYGRLVKQLQIYADLEE